MLIDVRDAGEFAKGHMKGAVNIRSGDMMDKAATLPAAKPIVFVCAPGARSGEAYDIVKMDRKDLNDVLRRRSHHLSRRRHLRGQVEVRRCRGRLRRAGRGII